MINKKLALLLFSVLLFLITIPARASDPVSDRFHYPIYVGITGGYGETTWGNLVPKEANVALSVSTPLRVNEGGGMWGVYAGYEVIPYFAFEASYMRYPNADLYFDEMSLFSFFHDNVMEFTTRTETVSLIGKIMLIIPHTNIRAYSSFGAAEVHRFDAYVNRWRLSPTFGAGFNYNFNKRLMMELGTEYVAGYGQSELDPSTHYIPFLYSVFLRLAYRF